MILFSCGGHGPHSKYVTLKFLHMMLTATLFYSNKKRFFLSHSKWMILISLAGWHINWCHYCTALSTDIFADRCKLIFCHTFADVTVAMKVTSSGPQSIQMAQGNPVTIDCTYTSSQADIGELDIEWSVVSPDTTKKDQMVCKVICHCFLSLK